MCPKIPAENRDFPRYAVISYSTRPTGNEVHTTERRMGKAAQTRTVRIDEALHLAVKSYAYHGRLTVTEIIEAAVGEWLERRAPTLDRLRQSDKETAEILRSKTKPTRLRRHA